MKNYNLVPLRFKNGIQRDGTVYNSDSCIAGQWVRFYESCARKMGGYKVTDNGNENIIRTLFVVPRSGSIDLYIGRANSIGYINIDIQGNATAEVDRTPITGFTPDENNIWSFDIFTNTFNGIVLSYIVAQVAPNGNDISNNVEGPIFAGQIGDNAPLTPLVDSNSNPLIASGGVVYSAPTMVAYGNDGLIRWSEEGDIFSWPALDDPNPNYLVVANTKIVKVYRNRGGTTPTLLIWSLNSLSRATYTQIGDGAGGVTNTYVNATIEDDISIISSNCIVKYNQMFFWIGVDQFYFFNGIVQKLKNTMNNDWFFDNVNLSQRQKIWGVSVPRYKEIWWFYPRGEATECNAAIIYNLEEECWYDSFIDRSAGVPTSVYPYPIFASSKSISISTNSGITETYPIWTHEFGYNEVRGNNVFAIDSFFETNQHDLWSSNPQASKYLRNRRIAPDLVQNKTMYITINNQKYPRASTDSVLQDGPYSFESNTEKLDFASQGPIVSFVFRSNERDGFYQMGKTIYFWEEGDTFK